MKTLKDKNGNTLGTFLEQGDASGSGGTTLHTLRIKALSYGSGDYKTETQLVLKVTDPNINSEASLLNYLKTNGFISSYDESETAVSGYVLKTEICTGFEISGTYGNMNYKVVLGISAFYEDDEWGIALSGYEIPDGTSYSINNTWIYTGSTTTFEYLN